MRQIFTPSATARLYVKLLDDLKEPREMASEILSAIFQNVVMILVIVPSSATLIAISSSQVMELVMTRAIPQNATLITEIAGSATMPPSIVAIMTSQPTMFVISNACRFIAILTTTTVPRFMSMLWECHKTNRMKSLDQVLWKTRIETCLGRQPT